MLGIYGGQGGSVLLRGAVLAVHAGLYGVGGGKGVQCRYGVRGAMIALHAGLSVHGNRGLGVALRGPPCPPPPARAAKGGAAAEWPRSCTKHIGWHGGGAEWTKLSSSWCGIPGRLRGTAWPATEGWLLRTAQPGDELWSLLPVRQPGVGAGSRAYRAYGREGPASAVCHGCHCT